MSRNTIKIQRLARKEESANIKRIVSLSILTLVLAVLLFTVGVSLLGKFTDLLGLVFKGKEDKQSGQTFVAPPVLDDLPQATNSAKLKVTGFFSEGDKIEIYLDDELAGEATPDGNKFEYDGLVLKSGDNTISAKAFKGSAESDSSREEVVSLNTREPTLRISSPEEGQNFSGNNRIKVSGETDSDSQIYANGFLASVGADGKFEILVPVSEGESTIEIKALNSAGNTKIEKRKITFRK